MFFLESEWLPVLSGTKKEGNFGLEEMSLRKSQNKLIEILPAEKLGWKEPNENEIIEESILWDLKLRGSNGEVYHDKIVLPNLLLLLLRQSQGSSFL